MLNRRGLWVPSGPLLEYRSPSRRAEVEGAFRVFGLTTDASLEDVKQAFNRKASAVHPDRAFATRGDIVQASREIQRLTDARALIFSLPRVRESYGDGGDTLAHTYTRYSSRAASRGRVPSASVASHAPIPPAPAWRTAVIVRGILFGAFLLGAQLYNEHQRRVRAARRWRSSGIGGVSDPVSSKCPIMAVSAAPPPPPVARPSTAAGAAAAGSVRLGFVGDMDPLSAYLRPPSDLRGRCPILLSDGDPSSWWSSRRGTPVVNVNSGPTSSVGAGGASGTSLSVSPGTGSVTVAGGGACALSAVGSRFATASTAEQLATAGAWLQAFCLRAPARLCMPCPPWL
eukprot:TRINITY_DN67807_c0_g1_i1.p1 TRINITY_DN67807_c0_g1~~TRINITY_DN67807_c0_g1_i1.p1  ORF type:complete len:343 (+),score=-5.89 TRINITY_DN67807_c0_g1_i1:248-1276(+)